MRVYVCVCVCSKCGAFTPVELIRVEEVRLISGTGGLERPQHDVLVRDTLIKKGERHTKKKKRRKSERSETRANTDDGNVANVVVM